MALFSFVPTLPKGRPSIERTVALIATVLVASTPTGASAQGRSTAPPPAVVTDTTPTVRFGAYIDGYYAWDFNRPASFDRAYTTQPARHAEFNVNLAFIEAKLTGPKYRGRLALQFGTAVQANYAGEPRIGHISGPGVSQFIQEATIGYQLSRTLWLDAGIFFAHTGLEGWISRDNLSYSRSLIADFSPYYEAGAKLTWTPAAAVTAQLDVLNGWQNISNYNTPPALGLRVDYVASPRLTLSYDNFFGDVAADSLPARYRLYHDFIAQLNPSTRWQLAGTFSLGTQGRSTADDGTATWYGAAIFAKYRPRPNVGVVARLERYSDPDQVIVQTGLPDPFRTNGGSIGLDVAPVPRVLWRVELRGFRSDAAVWPLNRSDTFGRDNWFVVSSLALTF